MNRAKRLIFTVTNELNFDQRMIRICHSLAEAGYKVQLVGRAYRDSAVLEKKIFQQRRLRCIFRKGALSYAEYNIRLFFYLLFRKSDLLCAIDLDTIIPVYIISKIKATARVYDAHELFCEMKEVVTRPVIYRSWKLIEKLFVPRFRHGYTVNSIIAGEFRKMYKVDYRVIRNMPVRLPVKVDEKKEKYILYQGSVNEGRCFETLIPAMKFINARLMICGDGNFMKQSKDLVKQNKLEDKVIFKGKIPPAALREITLVASVGITLFENNGLSNYYSLANRFFDYVHAAVPQVCVAYPAYNELNAIYKVAELIEECSTEKIAGAINRLLNDQETYANIQNACLVARTYWNWQNEEKLLLNFYREILMK